MAAVTPRPEGEQAAAYSYTTAGQRCVRRRLAVTSSDSLTQLRGCVRTFIGNNGLVVASSERAPVSIRLPT